MHISSFVCDFEIFVIFHQLIATAKTGTFSIEKNDFSAFVWNKTKKIAALFLASLIPVALSPLFLSYICIYIYHGIYLLSKVYGDRPRLFLLRLGLRDRAIQRTGSAFGAINIETEAFGCLYVFCAYSDSNWVRTGAEVAIFWVDVFEKPRNISCNLIHMPSTSYGGVFTSHPSSRRLT